MPRLRRSFDFASIQLLVESERPVSVSEEPLRCEPELPLGMRVDVCVVDSITIDCIAGSRFSVQLEILPQETGDWEASLDPGEALDAVSFRWGSGYAGCIGMRDADWLEHRYGLRLLDRDLTNLRLTASYEATTPTKPLVQVATAWTTTTLTEQEALSSWFAIDLALYF